MSYILDALRRAEAQRRQGQTPVLEQVAATPVPAPGDTTAARTRRLAVVLVLLLAAAAIVGAWWGRRATSPASAPAPSVPSAANAASAASAPIPRTVTATPAPAARAPQPARPRAPVQAAASAPPPAKANAPTLPASTPSPPLAARALPEPRRSEVQRLPLGGAVQSQDRSQSFVLMDGQLVREGQTLAPGIVLERIDARSLRLRVDGRAVELAL